MKVTWLTQAGLLFEGNGISIMVDPYLSDSVAKIEPKKSRRMPIDEKYLAYTPDVILITHEHIDHLDPETLMPILNGNDREITVMAPHNAYNKLLTFGGEHNYVMMNPHTVWSQGGRNLLCGTR